MNNICNRNCHWKYDGYCCPEDDLHFQDGTACTSKCSEYLHDKRIDTQMNMWSECKDILNHCTYVQLRKAYYLLRNIDKAVIALNKQIPKKLNNDSVMDETFWGQEPFERKIKVCPGCNNIYLRDQQLYCDKCGQAIDWEE